MIRKQNSHNQVHPLSKFKQKNGYKSVKLKIAKILDKLNVMEKSIFGASESILAAEKRFASNMLI